MECIKHPGGLSCCLFLGGGSVVVDKLFIFALIVGVLCLIHVLVCSTLCPF